MSKESSLSPQQRLEIESEVRKGLFRIAGLFGIANLGVVVGGLWWAVSSFQDWQSGSLKGLEADLKQANTTLQATLVGSVDEKVADYFSGLDSQLSRIEESAKKADATLLDAYGDAKYLLGQVALLEDQADSIKERTSEVSKSLSALSDLDAIAAAGELVEKFSRSDLNSVLPGYIKAKHILPVNCHSPEIQINQTDVNFDKHVSFCEFEVPVNGIMYLSLQGHVISRDGKTCAFGIFWDNKPINDATRNNPSLTHVKSWLPGFMAETIHVKEGTGELGVRLRGANCAIHDADISGIFIPSA